MGRKIAQRYCKLEHFFFKQFFRSVQLYVHMYKQKFYYLQQISVINIDVQCVVYVQCTDNATYFCDYDLLIVQTILYIQYLYTSVHTDIVYVYCIYVEG